MRPSVALVGETDSDLRVGALLEEQGFDCETVDSVADLLEAEAAPSLIVLLVEGAVSRAVASSVVPLQRAFERVPIVLLCRDIRSRDLRAALSGGAAGLVLESQLPAALGPSLQAVLTGQVCVPREHAKEAEPATLSAREKQILGLVVMGYMNSQIAEQLFVAESTVKSHLSSAFAKLGVRSRNEAVDLILDTKRGLGLGILALEGEPLEAIPTAT